MSIGNRFTPKKRNSLDGFVLSGYFFSFLYAILILIPLYLVIISAFKNNAEIITTPLAFPTTFDFGKFVQAQANVNLVRAMLISVVVTIGAEFLTLFLAFPAAYAVARLQTRLANFAEAIFSLGFLIPGLAILMPIYLMTAKAGLLYHPIALVILYPAFNLPLSMILLTGFMRKLPRELEESAVMDGGNVLQIIFSYFLPDLHAGDYHGSGFEFHQYLE